MTQLLAVTVFVSEAGGRMAAIRVEEALNKRWAEGCHSGKPQREAKI